jgi:SpoIIAA-like
MIEVLEGLPDNVVGIVAKGRLTSDDCNKVLKPLMESSQRHEKVRLYYEIDCRFPGAAWTNLRLGIKKHSGMGAGSRRYRRLLATRDD